MRRNKSFNWGSVALGCAFLGMFLPRHAAGVIFYSTSDPTHNTTAPTGALADSGWQFMGTWGGFTGTTISPNHFITATHVGGAVGQTFTFQGVGYKTTGVVNQGDLAVWTVEGNFDHYAPILSAAPTVGAEAVIIGRGTQRGAEVSKNGELKGWQWGAADGVMRWGENSVTAHGGGLIRFAFDSGGGPNEAHLSSGDSGGAVFLQDDGEWKLAGINYGVEGPFSLTLGGAQFNAAIFDKGGLYRAGSFSTDTATDKPSSFYATSLAANYSWISSVIAVQVPEPGTTALIGAAGVLLLGRKLRRRG